MNIVFVFCGGGGGRGRGGGGGGHGGWPITPHRVNRLNSVKKRKAGVRKKKKEKNLNLIFEVLFFFINDFVLKLERNFSQSNMFVKQPISSPYLVFFCWPRTTFRTSAVRPHVAPATAPRGQARRCGGCEKGPRSWCPCGQTMLCMMDWIALFWFGSDI